MNVDRSLFLSPGSTYTEVKTSSQEKFENDMEMKVSAQGTR